MESKPPQILPVREPPKDKPRKNLHPHLPDLPCIMVMTAPTKSGKSTTLSNLILRD